MFLVAPGSLHDEAARYAFYEASWQRPDLYFALELAPHGAPLDLAVTLPDAPGPPGFRSIWQRGGLTVWRRARR